MGFWSDLMPMGRAKELSEKEKETLKDKFRAFAEKEMRKANIAENKVRNFISGEEWENFKHLCCYSYVPYKLENDVLFCFGIQNFNGVRKGAIGVAVKSLEGFYQTTIDCPYWEKEDCPLRKRIAARNRKVEREINF